MALYPVYATLADLATYLGVSEANLPSNSQRLLVRASELIKQATLSNIISTNANHLEAAKLATCAQVEFWNSVDESTAIVGNLKSFKLDDLSMDFDTPQAYSGSVCMRARAYLNDQSLLYRGVRLSVNRGDD